MADQISLQVAESQVSAGSAVTVTANFRTRATASASVPTSIRYRVDCLTTGRAIVEDTSVSAASSASILIPGISNAIVDDDNETEKRQITVTADYGLSTQVRASTTWTVRNIHTFPLLHDFPDSLQLEPYYPQTAAELAAGITPTAYFYVPGDVRRYGAVGDGSTDDTTALQAAFNSNDYVFGQPTHTYLVSQASTKTYDAVAHSYCLAIPSGVQFNGQWCTIKLANSQNATILINDGAGSTQDSDITIVNLSLDGNETNQTTPAAGEMAMLKLYNVVRPRVDGLKCSNARDYFGRFLKCYDVYLNSLYGVTSDGDAWSFGVAGTNNLFGGFIDNVYAEDTHNGVYGTLQGNTALFTGEDLIVGKVVGLNCGGGVKIQGPSSRLQFGQFKWTAGANSSTNSGIKIQGQAGLVDVTDVTIGQIETSDCPAEGTYLTECERVQIGSIRSLGDGVVGSNPSVLVADDASRVQIGSIHCEDGGQTGVSLQGVDIQVGRIFAKNNGQVTASQANVSLAATANGVDIASLISEDDQTGAHTANRGLNLVSGCKNITVQSYRSKGDYATAGNHLVDSGATNFKLGSYRVDDADLYVPLSSTTQGANIGSGEDTLQTLTIKARSLYRNGNGYRIRAWGLVANNANAKTVRVKFGGSTIQTTAMTTGAAAFFDIDSTVIRSGSSTQQYVSKMQQGGATIINDVERGGISETDTSDIAVTVTGDATSDNDIVCYALTVTPL